MWLLPAAVFALVAAVVAVGRPREGGAEGGAACARGAQRCAGGTGPVRLPLSAAAPGGRTVARVAAERVRVAMLQRSAFAHDLRCPPASAGKLRGWTLRPRRERWRATERDAALREANRRRGHGGPHRVPAHRGAGGGRGEPDRRRAREAAHARRPGRRLHREGLRPRPAAALGRAEPLEAGLPDQDAHLARCRPLPAEAAGRAVPRGACLQVRAEPRRGAGACCRRSTGSARTRLDGEPTAGRI